MRTAKWAAFRTDQGSEVIPIDDVVGHEVGEDCACMPAVELLKADDGSDRWMVTHEAWDGRE